MASKKKKLAKKVSKKHVNTNKKIKQEKPEPKIIELKLTQNQLLHIRDLMSVSLAGEDERSISLELASKNKVGAYDENELWNVIVDACKEANIPIEHDVPDYKIALSIQPKLFIIKDDEEGEDGED